MRDIALIVMMLVAVQFADRALSESETCEIELSSLQSHLESIDREE